MNHKREALQRALIEEAESLRAKAFHPHPRGRLASEHPLCRFGTTSPCSKIAGLVFHEYGERFLPFEQVDDLVDWLVGFGFGTKSREKQAVLGSNVKLEFPPKCVPLGDEPEQRSTRWDALRGTVARMFKDGELDPEEGGPFIMDRDDAVSTLHGLIDAAREPGIGSEDDGDLPHPVNGLRNDSSGIPDGDVVWLPTATTRKAAAALEALFAMDGIVNQRGIVCRRASGTPECIILRDEDEDILLCEPATDDLNPERHVFQHDTSARGRRCRLCEYPEKDHTLGTKPADYRKAT